MEKFVFACVVISLIFFPVLAQSSNKNGNGSRIASLIYRGLDIEYTLCDFPREASTPKGKGHADFELHFIPAFIKKGTGTTVKIWYAMYGGQKGAISWFEAANCCKQRKQRLLNINNKMDIKAYNGLPFVYANPLHDEGNGIVDHRKGIKDTIAWTDIHGFQDEWTNLKGGTPSQDLWDDYKPPRSSGNCNLLVNDPRHPNEYTLKTTDCERKEYSFLICENEDYTWNPLFNYNCENVLPEMPPYDKNYWTTVLRTPCGNGNRQNGATNGGEGWFIADADRTLWIAGHLESKESIILFFAKFPIQVITRPTFGIFLSSNPTEKYPFGNLHGVLKPYDKLPFSAEFIVDKSIPATFTPDSESRVIEGEISQSFPILFTVFDAPYINMPTPGTLRISLSVSPVYPLGAMHGSMKPSGNNPRVAEFVSDPFVWGSFTADGEGRNPLLGKMTQTFPPEFLPQGNLGSLPHAKQWGVWRPQDPSTQWAISLGLLNPVDVPNKIIFKAGAEVTGQFIPDRDTLPPIPGYMTKKNPKIFTMRDAGNISIAVFGTWYEKDSQQGTHGVLKPDRNIPPKSAYFNPQGTTDTNSGTSFTDNDFVISKTKKSWEDAKRICENAGLLLFVIESEDENQFLSSSPRVKEKPFNLKTTFWIAVKFISTDYTKLIWEPSKRLFPNFRVDKGNGISKTWATGEPIDDEGSGKEICVDISFPASTPVWYASNCELKKYFICSRPGSNRNDKNPGVPITLMEDDDSATNGNPSGEDCDESMIALNSKFSVSCKKASVR